MPAPLEITDVISPAPVRQDKAVRRLQASGQHRAARLVARMPARGGVLDPDEVAALVRRVHAELQRLAEELQLPRLVAEHLRELAVELPGLTRIVDVGCGGGHLVRWLAENEADDPLLGHLELVGVDLDADLIALARHLSPAEHGNRVRFEVADAFDPGVAVTDPGSTVLISSGLLHHFPADRLPQFFARHAELGVGAFCHFDPEPGWLTNLGAFIFHRARMREAVSRHDGNLSMRRAHPSGILLAAAESTGSYRLQCAQGQNLLRVLRPIRGVLR